MSWAQRLPLPTGAETPSTLRLARGEDHPADTTLCHRRQCLGRGRAAHTLPSRLAARRVYTFTAPARFGPLAASGQRSGTTTTAATSRVRVHRTVQADDPTTIRPRPSFDVMFREACSLSSFPFSVSLVTRCPRRGLYICLKIVTRAKGPVLHSLEASPFFFLYETMSRRYYYLAGERQLRTQGRDGQHLGDRVGSMAGDIRAAERGVQDLLSLSASLRFALLSSRGGLSSSCTQ